MAANTIGIRSIFAAIHAAPVVIRHTPREQPPTPGLFVTISRQGGAGGRTVAQRLVNRLNVLDPGDVPWTLWDRALVEKVAADNNIARELIESLEDTSRSWVEEFLASLAGEGNETEAKVYQVVASAIRALAQRGRVVVVGRGGVYITRNMPGGIHVRLIAPAEYRARHMAEQLNVSAETAMTHILALDKSRSAFYHRYWPKEIISPEAFTVTINTAKVNEDRAVESLVPLILPHVGSDRAGQVRQGSTAL